MRSALDDGDVWIRMDLAHILHTAREYTQCTHEARATVFIHSVSRAEKRKT